MLSNHTCGGANALTVGEWLHSTMRHWRTRDAVYCGGLTDSRVHGWHGLAAILTVMTMRRTAHGIAALHRLFGRSHPDAVERIRCQSGD